MKKCALILCEQKMSPKSKMSLSSAEIVFKPMYSYLEQTLKDCGINEIFLLFDKKQRTEMLRNFIAHNAKCDIFVAEGISPFISKETIEKSYEAFLKNEKKITGIGSAFSNIFCGAWMTVNDLKRNCSLDVEHEIIVDDIVSIFDGVNEFDSKNADDFLYAKNLLEAQKLNDYKRKNILEKYMLNGVIIPCTDGVIIEENVVLSADAVILAGTRISGNSKIESGAIVGPNSIVENSVIEENAKLDNSHCYASVIKAGAEVGPFVRVRPDCIIGENARVGNFVELKNVVVDKGAKISHLSYIGDGSVGKEVNIGCGCATVNFDGTNKHRTVIEDGAFIGCGVNLVAPVTVGKDAFVAAGSTVVENVPASSLAIARTRQVIKNGWVEKKKPYKRMKKNG